GGTHAVRELLEDTLANFDRRERELEWTAEALALYLPPQREWSDKYGNRHTLDEVAEELLNRPLSSSFANCRGGKSACRPCLRRPFLAAIRPEGRVLLGVTPCLSPRELSTPSLPLPISAGGRSPGLLRQSSLPNSAD